MKKIIKKYGLLIAVLTISLLMLAVNPDAGIKSFQFTVKNFLNFAVTLAPVFVLIGLLDVWVPRETMVRLMGEKSGLRGVLIAFLFGIITAVPIYALLPVSGILLKKGSQTCNVIIFLCSSASIRIPLLLFEASALGWKFTAVRMICNIFCVLIIAFLIERILTPSDKQEIYERNNQIEQE